MFCCTENMADKDTYTKFIEWLKTNYTDSTPSDYEWQVILNDDTFGYQSEFEGIDNEIEEEIIYNSSCSERYTEVITAFDGGPHQLV